MFIFMDSSYCINKDQTIFFEKPLPEKTACFILDPLFGTEFQKFWRKSNTTEMPKK